MGEEVAPLPADRPEARSVPSAERATASPLAGIPLFLFFLTAGLALAPYFVPSFTFNILPFIAGALWLPLRRRRLSPLLLALFFATLGVALYFVQITPPGDPGHVRAFRSGWPVIVEGTVLSLQPRTLGRWSADVEAGTVGTHGIVAPVRGRVRLTIAEGYPVFRPGDRIRFRSRLQEPRAFGTPGEFDFARHLAYRGIFVTAFVPAARDIAVFPVASVANVENWRTRIGAAIDRAVPLPEAPLVRALVIGDKGGITPEQRDLLSRGGVSHLFSISGLHFGLIALFLFSLLRIPYCRSERLLLLGPPRRYLPVLLVPFLLLYLLLTGDALPTRRAFLMATAGAALLLGARRTPPLKLLAAAAFVLLVADPLALFEPSFQLSFAGVLGIMLLLPRWQERLRSAPRPLRWIGLLFLTTVAASLATTPLVLLHFQLLPPAGLVTNLFAVPAIGFAAVPLGLAGALCVPWWPQGADFFLLACGAAIEGIMVLVEQTVALPGLGGWTWYSPPLQLAAVFLLVAALLYRRPTARGRLSRFGLLAAAGLLTLWSPPSSPELRIVSLSVGQGDATLLSLPGDRHFLVDGGGLHSPTFDVGERLVAPALGRLGVNTLEAVILTHDQMDHRKGLVHVLEEFPVRAFWSGVPMEALDFSLRDVLRRRGTPVRLLPPGWTTAVAEEDLGLRLYVPRTGADNPNDASVVVHALLGGDGVLLTGDLEAAGVADLAGAMPAATANLLKLPHHGSRGSHPELLLDRLHPKAAFVSAGAGNRYRFPHAEVVDALTAREIPLYRTDTDGTLRFRTDGRGWRVERWHRGLFH